MAYIPNTDADRHKMLAQIGLDQIEDLFKTIPGSLRYSDTLDIGPAMDQIALARKMSTLAAKNWSADRYPTFLGAGVYDHYVPPTVAAITGRSEFYTSYTPYQPEVSQGVLQSIYEFQTLIADLFGMEIANASMYDAASGLAEAAIMAADLTGRKHVVVLGTVHPSYREVLVTYLRHMDIAIEEVPQREGVGDYGALDRAARSGPAAVLVQHPNFFGNLENMPLIASCAHSNGAKLIAVVDPISLGLIKPPGDYGVDIAVAEGQGLGCPMGFGGPLLGLFACKKEYVRRLPGRIVGATTDIEGKPAFVMTLRTREQDIRRERATSNICTNVALQALAATVYLATMGRYGLRRVAELCVQHAHYAADQIAKLPGFGLSYPNAAFFKEFAVTTPVDVDQVNHLLMEAGIVGGYKVSPHQMLLAVTETRTKDEIDALIGVLGGVTKVD